MRLGASVPPSKLRAENGIFELTNSLLVLTILRVPRHRAELAWTSPSVAMPPSPGVPSCETPAPPCFDSRPAGDLGTTCLLDKRTCGPICHWLVPLHDGRPDSIS